MRSIVLAVLVVAACGDDGGGHAIDGPAHGDGAPPIDTAMTPDGNPLTPDTLAGTGLCLDAGCTQISADVVAYAPQYTLWSDGATKRRWIQLPAGATIDTSDMDYWKFPVGTKIWKEFTRDTVRCETRYMVKLADEGTSTQPWFMVSYQWSADQLSTTQAKNGATDVNGTGHDIPSTSQCHQCHDNLAGPNRDRGRVLGFNALSLDYVPAAATTSPLDDLIAGDRLTDAPPAGSPHYPLTGLTAHERTAFGYFHANCGHCHNPTSPVHDAIAIELRMLTGKLTSDTAPAFTTTVGKPASQGIPQLANVHCSGAAGNPCVVKPKDTDNSVLWQRVNTGVNDMYGSTHMPALGSEVTDPALLSAVSDWIADQ